jgi:hypothetical protein
MMLEREPKYWTKTDLGATSPSKIPHGLTRTPRAKKGQQFSIPSSRFPNEHCFLGGFQASPVCLDKRNMKFKKNNQHWWNYIDSGKLVCSMKNLLQCHFVHHKPHMD